MKKFASVFLLSFLFLAGTQEMKAQEMSVKEVKERICKTKWFLRRYEMDGKAFKVPGDYFGTRMIFLPSGKMYFHKKDEDGSDSPRYDWKLSDDKITMTIHDGSKDTFRFKLEDFIGYKIYIKVLGGDEDGLTYIWEESEKL